MPTTWSGRPEQLTKKTNLRIFVFRNVSKNEMKTMNFDTCESCLVKMWFIFDFILDLEFSSYISVIYVNFYITIFYVYNVINVFSEKKKVESSW